MHAPFPYDSAPKYPVYDNDCTFSDDVTEAAQDQGARLSSGHGECAGLATTSLPIKPVISANIVIDSRFKPRQMEQTVAAGINDLFFGLESANARLRRLMKKPGKASGILRALRDTGTVSAGHSHIGVGVIIAWPGETEAEHFDTVSFLESYSELEGLLPSANLSPFFVAPSAHDSALMESFSGEARGLLWTSDEPARASLVS